MCSSYGFFPIDETHPEPVTADISGKGVPAALFMAMLCPEYKGAGGKVNV
jgi:serine phosphatase RsbU (regulator of sigma subunit)